MGLTCNQKNIFDLPSLGKDEKVVDLLSLNFYKVSDRETVIEKSLEFNLIQITSMPTSCFGILGFFLLIFPNESFSLGLIKHYFKKVSYLIKGL